jgi:hypothetical protein
MAYNCRVEVERAGWRLPGVLASMWLAGCTPLADADAFGAGPVLAEPTRMNDAETSLEPRASGAEPAVEAPTLPNAPAEQPAVAGDIPLDNSPGSLPAEPVANAPDAGGLLADAGAPALDICPEGNAFGSSCYRAALMPLPWNAARADCLANGADLVVIDDAREDDFVGGLAESGLWIGATDQSREDEFEWVDGSAVVFDNWGPGQPDAFPGPDCVQKRQEPGEPWYDQPCSSAFLYVCESELTP